MQKPLQPSSSETCQICGDNVGKTTNGDLFVACNECAFPVCRPCYEYERKDGNQACPQCNTRYKRHQGTPCPYFSICSIFFVVRRHNVFLGGKRHVIAWSRDQIIQETCHLAGSQESRVLISVKCHVC
jgi:uncharacterized protein (DUF983 family)